LIFIGVGKTTLVKNILSKLQEKQIPCLGFFTEEKRENGVRTGFDVVPIDQTNGRKSLAFLS
jgi:nucleoside-triphosphatase THEP1